MTLRLAAVPHLPRHGKTLRDGGKAGLQRRQFHREIGCGEHHAHEELFGLDVIELLRIENVLSVLGEERRDRRHDAGAVGTGQGQDELMIGHGADLATIQAEGETLVCGPALSPPTGLRQSGNRSQDEQSTTICVGARPWLTD